jgi:hypothetical protein
MKRTNTPTADRGCFEACRPVAATGSRPRRRDWFRVRNVTAIEFQKSRRCGESGGPLPSESSRVTPVTHETQPSPGLAVGAFSLLAAREVTPPVGGR